MVERMDGHQLIQPSYFTDKNERILNKLKKNLDGKKRTLTRAFAPAEWLPRGRGSHNHFLKTLHGVMDRHCEHSPFYRGQEDTVGTQ